MFESFTVPRGCYFWGSLCGGLFWGVIMFGGNLGRSNYLGGSILSRPGSSFWIIGGIFRVKDGEIQFFWRLIFLVSHYFWGVYRYLFLGLLFLVGNIISEVCILGVRGFYIRGHYFCIYYLWGVFLSGVSTLGVTNFWGILLSRVTTFTWSQLSAVSTSTTLKNLCY